MFDQPSDAPRITNETLAPVRPAETPWVDFTYNDRLSRERLQRIGDVLLACALILLTLPLVLFVALAIKLDSPGPILIREERRSRTGSPCSILRFRTAVSIPARVSGAVSARRGRFTKTGDFLRFSRIDELPQVLNVLRGEMTLIGVPGTPQAFGD